MAKSSYGFVILSAIWWIFAISIYMNNSEADILYFFNSKHSETWDKWVPVITRGGEIYFILPFLLWIYLGFGYQLKNYPLLLTVIIAALLPSVCTNLLKSYFNHPRPLTVFATEEWWHIVPGYVNNYMKSFPSGHATGVFACMSIGAYLSQNRTWVWTLLFFLIAVIVAFSRLYLMQHFWLDILCGSFVGTWVSNLVLYFYHHSKYNQL